MQAIVPSIPFNFVNPIYSPCTHLLCVITLHLISIEEMHPALLLLVVITFAANFTLARPCCPGGANGKASEYKSVKHLSFLE